MAVYGISLLVPVLDEDGAMGPLTVRDASVGAVVCASLVFRRRRPLAVLAVTASGMAAYVASSGHKSPLMLATMIALYTCALYRPRPEAVLEGVAVGALLTGLSLVAGDRGLLGPEIVALSALSAFAVAVGIAVRDRRAYVAAVEERAQRAERTREEEARRRVVDERLRIARELHDVLAHHIAIINVQSGVAAHVMETEPGQARESLAHIRRAARSSLEEVRTTIGLLRRPDAPDEAAVEPSPGLDALPDLIAGLTAAGLIVDRKVAGTPAGLPAAVELTAYRVVQEALTNASRYASRPYAELELDYLPSALRIRVRNPADPAGRPGSAEALDPGEPGQGGHGLLGMRERAHALGGTFAARLADGRFEVQALLPHEGAGT